jgi:cystathionine gamma-synthase
VAAAFVRTCAGVGPGRVVDVAVDAAEGCVGIAEPTCAAECDALFEAGALAEHAALSAPASAMQARARGASTLGSVSPMSSQHPNRGFSTRAIHAGQDPDPLTGAVTVPIYQTSTYKQDGVGGLRGGYEYSRSANPTRTAVEEALAALEGGARGLAFASGLAAEDSFFRAVCRPGDHVILPGDAYGGTFRLVARVLAEWGVEYTPVPLADLDAVRAAVRPTTKVVWCETPTNPLLGIADIAALADIARAAGARLVVDNTFATPYLQQPLALGADAVVHSTTKYLGGHSDVVGGALIAADAEFGEQLAFHQNAMGAIAGPFDAWLVLRGIKTLGVRMDRHCSNAARVVEMLDDHPAVSQVLYPGLPQHPGHDVAARQMRDFGGMVSFRLRGGEETALKVCGLVEVFTLGESLGGVESLIEHPGRMTHASVAGSPLEVPSDLVRLSVGIEDVEDLLADLAQALA